MSRICLGCGKTTTNSDECLACGADLNGNPSDTESKIHEGERTPPYPKRADAPAGENARALNGFAKPTFESFTDAGLTDDGMFPWESEDD